MYKRVKEQYNEYHQKAKNIPTIGFTHHLTPKLIYKVLNAISADRIKDTCVLEVGCGQGYFIPHFLNLGAKFVIGIDNQKNMENFIPKQWYKNKGLEHRVRFTEKNFLLTNYYNINIVLQIIGLLTVRY